MNEDNKTRLMDALRKLALIIYALITIITCMGVWNYCKENFVCLMAGVLLVCNGVAVVKLWKKTTPEENKK